MIAIELDDFSLSCGSTTDSLTGLLNRSAFNWEMSRLIAAGETFSVVMLDLDRFKGVNEALGLVKGRIADHQAGDRLLQEVAEAMVKASRATDAVCRYGGDEFAVSTPRTEGPEAVVIGERVCAAVASIEVPVPDPALWHLSGSVGIAFYPADGGTGDQLFKAADQAMLLAKRDGGGCVRTAAQVRDL